MKPEQITKLLATLQWSFQQLADYTGYKKYQVLRMEKGTMAISDEFHKRVINAVKAHIKDSEKILQLLQKTC